MKGLVAPRDGSNSIVAESHEERIESSPNPFIASNIKLITNLMRRELKAPSRPSGASPLSPYRNLMRRELKAPRGPQGVRGRSSESHEERIESDLLDVILDLHVRYESREEREGIP